MKYPLHLKNTYDNALYSSIMINISRLDKLLDWINKDFLHFKITLFLESHFTIPLTNSIIDIKNIRNIYKVVTEGCVSLSSSRSTTLVSEELLVCIINVKIQREKQLLCCEVGRKDYFTFICTYRLTPYRLSLTVRLSRRKENNTDNFSNKQI